MERLCAKHCGTPTETDSGCINFSVVKGNENFECVQQRKKGEFFYFWNQIKSEYHGYKMNAYTNTMFQKTVKSTMHFFVQITLSNGPLLNADCAILFESWLIPIKIVDLYPAFEQNIFIRHFITMPCYRRFESDLLQKYWLQCYSDSYRLCWRYMAEREEFNIHAKYRYGLLYLLLLILSLLYLIFRMQNEATMEG